MRNSNAFQSKKGFRGAFLPVAKCLNIALMSLPFCLGWHWFYAGKIAESFSLTGNLAIIGLHVFLYALLASLYNVYSVPVCRISELIYSQSLTAVLSNFILFVVIALLARHYVPVWPLLLALCSQIIISALWSFLVRKLYFAACPPLRTVFIRAENDGADVLAELKKTKDRFRLTDEISISEYLREPERYLKEAEAIFLADIHSHERDKVIKDCVSNSIPLYLLPSIGDALIANAKLTHLFYHPFITMNVYSPSVFYLLIKRCLDIALSLLALVILSPLMAVVALLIRRDGGSVFYKQTRLTKDGKTFEVFKFRSMTMDAERDGVARLSTGENDSRVTPTGRVIRRFRIDELPQLFNILRGEMSIVGPRPERPELAAEYEKTLPEFSLRLQAKAGLTGYAQVYGKYNTTPYEKLLMDLQYMSRSSLMEDIKLLFVTVKVLFMKESTEGAGELSAQTQKDAVKSE